ncbi:MAG: hypothetical protein LBG43_07460 [Treponema sp.]|nr:hypothetical protein [Treponema sp.]
MAKPPPPDRHNAQGGALRSVAARIRPLDMPAGFRYYFIQRLKAFHTPAVMKPAERFLVYPH